MGRRPARKAEGALVELRRALDGNHVEQVTAWFDRQPEEELRRRGWEVVSRAWAEAEEVNEEAFSELSNTYEELIFLYEVAPKLGSILTPARLCRAAVAEILRAIPAQGAYVVGRDGRRAVRLASRGPYPYRDDPLWRETLEGSFTRADSPQMLEDFPDGSLPASFRAPRAGGIQSLLSCPMRVRGKVLGAITLFNRRDAASFSAADGKRLHALASQAAVALYNGRLVAELRETEQLRRELEIARDIQESLLPEKLATVEGLAVEGRCRMAAEVGGDYYDAFPVGDGRLAVLVADGMGHGLGAAMVMASFRTILRAVCRDVIDPGRVLDRVNRLLAVEYAKASTFVSCFYGVLDGSRGRFLCANAGHGYPLWRRKGGEVEELHAAGPPLGVFPDVAYKEEEVTLARGEALLLYTDGLSECMDRNRAQFGATRLARVFGRWKGRRLTVVLDAIFKSVDRFRGRAAQRDDMTALVLRRDD